MARRSHGQLMLGVSVLPGLGGTSPGMHVAVRQGALWSSVSCGTNTLIASNATAFHVVIVQNKSTFAAVM